MEFELEVLYDKGGTPGRIALSFSAPEGHFQQYQINRIEELLLHEPLRLLSANQCTVRSVLRLAPERSDLTEWAVETFGVNDDPVGF